MMSSIIGIDLGGTKTTVCRFTAGSFACEAEEQIATRAQEGLDATLGDCIELAQTLKTKETTAVGIGLAGLIHQPDGIVMQTPNIAKGSNVAVKGLLEKAVNLPVAVHNDAQCFALAEAVMGAGKGKKVVIGITMGTGVGGGIVIDGKVFHGSHGFAGEIGHMLLMPGKPPFETKDKRGEVEQFLSGTAMGKRCVDAKHPKDYLDGEVCEWMQPEIFREAAWLITNLTYLLDPDIIVFGGSAGTALKPHLKKIEAELQKWMLQGTLLPQLAVSTLKDAGAIGAAISTQQNN